MLSTVKIFGDFPDARPEGATNSEMSEMIKQLSKLKSKPK